MMKKRLILILLVFPVISFSQDGFVINGEISSLKQEVQVFLNYRQDGNEIKDSVQTSKGRFRFEGKLTQPVMAGLSIRHKASGGSVSGGREYLGFYLENSVIEILAKDSLKNAVVRGSQTDEDHKALTKLRLPYKRSADSLVAAYNSMSKEERNDSVWKKEAGRIMSLTSAGYDSVSKKFIDENLNSYISLQAFQEVELGYNFNPDLAASRFNRFPSTLRNSRLGKQMEATIETGKKTNTGVMAMDFEQIDTEGNKVRLSDFRGKYVLIDFWASWCAPCRAENPNLLKAYNKYQQNNFTILGVSLDEEDYRKAWLKAIEVDGMPWKQVSDLKGWKNEAAQLYGINAIPANFLVDPEGRIIARNLKGEELQERLRLIFADSKK